MEGTNAKTNDALRAGHCRRSCRGRYLGDRTERRRARRRRMPRQSEHTVAFVVCALALAATIAFTIFKLGAARRPRRRHLRDRWDSASTAGHRPLRTWDPQPASGPRRDQGLPRFLLERTAA